MFNHLTYGMAYTYLPLIEPDFNRMPFQISSDSPCEAPILATVRKEYGCHVTIISGLKPPVLSLFYGYIILAKIQPEKNNFEAQFFFFRIMSEFVGVERYVSAAPLD